MLNEQTATRLDVQQNDSLQWLKIVDLQHYQQSWEKASDYFQSQISQSDWVDAVSAVRSSIGELVSRDITMSKPVTPLSDAPEGEYNQCQYKSTFSQGEFIETVTLLKENGDWKVVGYFVK
ncbi:DUF4019 domain-containing protein [Vibrio ezurae]|uniref:DUF4019 domain-containing protein n=1 Tax=Vibrio ezurae NBRC 102218 TaxID=1219080 RepID=U3CFA5_9VIBR|nr:DUF4019 domain-containing protein [Vibrio ezurae]GAD79919.1 hypothetical protein VEZ01S_21_00410 [Vibrio ezurae NBRC 102218]